MGTHFFQQDPDWALFASTFLVIFLAELPDKTAVAVLILSSQRHPFGVFTGVCAAYVVQNIVAVLFGSALALLPPRVVHMGAGALFLVFAALMWFKKEEKGEGPRLASKGRFLKSAWLAFGVIFIAEWGDLTQLATATLVAKTGHPLTVFFASTSALWAASGMFVAIGRQAKKVIQPAFLQKVAAAAFGIVGLALLSGLGDR